MDVHYGYLPGCIGRITELHASYYTDAVGFGLVFEAKVAREIAEFCTGFDPVRDGIWLAVEGGTLHGSVIIDGSGAASRGAHLRWFITSDSARGKGTGNALLRAAMAFCDARAYASVYRWTFDQLHAAGRLYEKHGFRLETEQHGLQWGRRVNEQRFVRRVSDLIADQ